MSLKRNAHSWCSYSVDDRCPSYSNPERHGVRDVVSHECIEDVDDVVELSDGHCYSISSLREWFHAPSRKQTGDTMKMLRSNTDFQDEDYDRIGVDKRDIVNTEEDDDEGSEDYDDYEYEYQEFEEEFLEAIRSGNLTRIEDILQIHSFNPAFNYNEAIINASLYGQLGIVQRLLQERDRGVDPSDLPIQVASFKGHLAIVERLLQEPDVDPSAEDNYPIRFASVSGHLDVVERLLQEQIVDPSARDNYAIQSASRYNPLAVVDRLLQERDRGVDPSADDNLAIREASLHGHLAIVERLLQEPDVDPSARDNEAIRWASENGHSHIVRVLENAIQQRQR